jgi:hypothetical protein
MNQEQQKAAREIVDGLIAQGFNTRRDIVELAASQYTWRVDEELDFDDAMPLVRPIVKARLEQRRRAEQRWTRLTDCDRLDLAFRDLEKQGIVARQNYWCCSNCGHFNAGMEAWEKRSKTGRCLGYVFFHEQDTECAPSGSLMLCFGTVEESGISEVELAGMVIDTLRRHGLKTEWSGDPQTRITVVGLKWRWRRFTRRPR